MRVVLLAFLSIMSVTCRTTRQDNQRHFADSEGSTDNLTGIKGGSVPASQPGQPPAPFPKPIDPIEAGAFYKICVAKNQLTSPQSLTIQALLAATHQQECAAGETWLRDQRNKTVSIESEALVELQTLALLQSYPHIADVYIKVAKGVDPICPLGKDQTCHFLKPDYE